MKLDNLLTSKYWRLIIPVVLGIIIIVIKSNSSTLSKLRCKWEKEAKAVRIDGVITAVYLDSLDRGVRTFEVFDENDTVKSSLLIHELSDIYSNLSKGDTISKMPGSLEVELFNRDKKIIHVLVYGCE